MREGAMTAAGAEARIVRPGGDPGAQPRDAADVADVVAAAAARGQPLRIVAGGTWLDAGRPVHDAVTLDLSCLTGIVDYTPGDLTLTALAATPLATIAAATDAHGQWLSLDPAGVPAGTLGATLATASTGPLGATIGRPRDVALGMEVVTGEGERIRVGGRVVKNVAGFDLVRLQVGAWGTLGVLTEATVRLRGRTAVDRTVALAVPPPPAVGEFVRRLRHLAATPPAAELLNAPLAAAVGLVAEPTVLIRVSGNEDAVSAQLTAIGALGSTQDVPPRVWETLAGSEPPGASVVRCSSAPSDVAVLWRAVDAALPAGRALIHATLERGVVRVILAPDGGPGLTALLRALPAGVACVVERAAPSEWTGVSAYAADRHSARLRKAFDPAGILNPGILGVARG